LNREEVCERRTLTLFRRSIYYQYEEAYGRDACKETNSKQEEEEELLRWI
jgi:hypothetical protein